MPRLLLILSIHTDGHGTVVEQFHLHVGTELARADGFAKTLREQLAEGFVEWDRVLVAAGPEPTGAIALLVAGKERKLAHDEYLALYVEYAAVHDVLLVVEDTQTDDFLCQPSDVVDGVVVAYSYEYHEAMSNGRFYVSADGDAGVTYSLYDCSHAFFKL